MLRRLSGTRIKAESFKYGAIIGVADLVDVITMSPSLEKDPHATGPYCLVFENARLFSKPISQSGRLNLYNLPDKIALKVQERLDDELRPAPHKLHDELASAVIDDPHLVASLRAEAYATLGSPEDMVRCAHDAITLRVDDLANTERYINGCLTLGMHEHIIVVVDRLVAAKSNENRWQIYSAFAHYALGDEDNARRKHALAHQHSGTPHAYDLCRDIWRETLHKREANKP
jgi:hypothetical protein